MLIPQVIVAVVTRVHRLDSGFYGFCRSTAPVRRRSIWFKSANYAQHGVSIGPAVFCCGPDSRTQPRPGDAIFGVLCNNDSRHRGWRMAWWYTGGRAIARMADALCAPSPTKVPRSLQSLRALLRGTRNPERVHGDDVCILIATRVHGRDAARVIAADPSCVCVGGVCGNDAEAAFAQWHSADNRLCVCPAVRGDKSSDGYSDEVCVNAALL